MQVKLRRDKFEVIQDNGIGPTLQISNDCVHNITVHICSLCWRTLNDVREGCFAWTPDILLKYLNTRGIYKRDISLHAIQRTALDHPASRRQRSNIFS
jgi:hypothetical protein